MSQGFRVPDLRGRQVSYLPFLAAALLFSLIGGFALAVSLPIDAALRESVGSSWYSHAQVHGHLQTVGFAGLFIVGVSYFLMPTLSRRPLALPRLAPLALGLLIAGVLLRTIGQPMADRAPMAALMAAGAWLEVAGAACYAANVFGTTARSARNGELFALMFLAGAAWFLVQAVVGAVWLTELARDGRTVLPAARSSTLVAMQVFAFHLAFIVGMVLRVFPTFFETKRMPAPFVLGAAALMEAGVVLTIVARVLADGRGADTWLLEDIGNVAFGVGLLWAGALTGWWRGPAHMTRIAKRFAAILWPAMLWLAVAARAERHVRCPRPRTFRPAVGDRARRNPAHRHDRCRLDADHRHGAVTAPAIRERAHWRRAEPLAERGVRRGPLGRGHLEGGWRVLRVGPARRVGALGHGHGGDAGTAVGAGVRAAVAAQRPAPRAAARPHAGGGDTGARRAT